MPNTVICSYAFGILLWELYTARRAFEGIGLAELTHEVSIPARKERVHEQGEADGTRLPAELTHEVDIYNIYEAARGSKGEISYAHTSMHTEEAG